MRIVKRAPGSTNAWSAKAMELPLSTCPEDAQCAEFYEHDKASAMGLYQAINKLGFKARQETIKQTDGSRVICVWKYRKGANETVIGDNGVVVDDDFTTGSNGFSPVTL